MRGGDFRIIPQEPWAEARERYRQFAAEDRPGSPYDSTRPAPFTAIDVVGVLLKPSTLISLTVLGVCVWALCGFPGLV